MRLLAISTKQGKAVLQQAILVMVPAAVHRGVMMADTLSFNAKIGVVNF